MLFSLRLYERYADLLPEGPERTRAGATARSAAALVGSVDLDRYATAFAPAIEVVDHRLLGTSRSSARAPARDPLAAEKSRAAALRARA